MVSVNKYLRKLRTHHSMAEEMKEEGKAREANDTEGGWRKGEQYTKEINTSRVNATIITIYPSNTAQIGPVGWVGWMTWKGTGGSIAGSVAAAAGVQSQRGHLSKGLSAPSEVNCG